MWNEIGGAQTGLVFEVYKAWVREMIESYSRWKSGRIVKQRTQTLLGPVPRTETFICGHCKRPVSAVAPGARPRSHCPHCLWSLHLDDRPGDRAAGDRPPLGGHHPGRDQTAPSRGPRLRRHDRLRHRARAVRGPRQHRAAHGRVRGRGQDAVAARRGAEGWLAAGRGGCIGTQVPGQAQAAQQTPSARRARRTSRASCTKAGPACLSITTMAATRAGTWTALP